jgi:uncharacterized protein
MKTGLEKLKLRDFCRTGQQRQVQLDAAHLPRFAQTLLQPLALPVAVTLQGDESAQPDGSLLQRLHITAHTEAVLQCQRCLEAYQQVIAVDAHFVLVDDEAAELAWDEQHADDASLDDLAPEPLVASAAFFNALVLVEDELILSMPLVPRHAVCPQELVPGLLGPGVDSVHDISEDGEAADEAEQIKVSPFAALQALKKNLN